MWSFSRQTSYVWGNSVAAYTDKWLFKNDDFDEFLRVFEICLSHFHEKLHTTFHIYITLHCNHVNVVIFMTNCIFAFHIYHVALQSCKYDHFHENGIQYSIYITLHCIHGNVIIFTTNFIRLGKFCGCIYRQRIAQKRWLWWICTCFWYMTKNQFSRFIYTTLHCNHAHMIFLRKHYIQHFIYTTLHCNHANVNIFTTNYIFAFHIYHAAL